MVAVGFLGLLWALLRSREGSALPSSSDMAFREALILRARKDIEDGVKEEGGHNLGPKVDEYLRNVGGKAPANWCAAAAWTWIRDAANAVGRPEILEVIKKTGGAKALADGPRKQSPSWILTAAEARASSVRPPPGSIVIWDRSNPMHSSWEGHVGVLENWEGSWNMHTIEGNSGPLGDRVARMLRSLDDPRLLWFIIVPEAR